MIEVNRMRVNVNRYTVLRSAGALCFGLGIGGGIIGKNVLFGVICFVLASILWITAEVLRREKDGD